MFVSFKTTNIFNFMFEENTKLYGILFLVFLRYTQKGVGKTLWKKMRCLNILAFVKFCSRNSDADNNKNAASVVVSLLCVQCLEKKMPILKASQ